MVSLGGQPTVLLMNKEMSIVDTMHELPGPSDIRHAWCVENFLPTTTVVEFMLFDLIYPPTQSHVLLE